MQPVVLSLVITIWSMCLMKKYKRSYKYWLGYIVGTIERFIK
jgi:hypothetical protein